MIFGKVSYSDFSHCEFYAQSCLSHPNQMKIDSHNITSIIREIDVKLISSPFQSKIPHWMYVQPFYLTFLDLFICST